MAVMSLLFPALGSMAKALIDGLVEYLRVCYNGALDVLDDWRTIVFVASCIGIAFSYGWFQCECSNPQVSLRPSHGAPKDPGSSIFTNPLEWWR